MGRKGASTLEPAIRLRQEGGGGGGVDNLGVEVFHERPHLYDSPTRKEHHDMEDTQVRVEQIEFEVDSTTVTLVASDSDLVTDLRIDEKVKLADLAENCGPHSRAASSIDMAKRRLGALFLSLYDDVDPDKAARRNESYAETNIERDGRKVRLVSMTRHATTMKAEVRFEVDAWSDRSMTFLVAPRARQGSMGEVRTFTKRANADDLVADARWTLAGVFSRLSTGLCDGHNSI